MKRNQKLMLALLVVTSMITACKKDDDTIPNPNPDPNESELITTMTLTFTDSANIADVMTATFKDPDGDGGNAPVQFDTIVLQQNKTYLVEILLLDESGSPVDTISNEVAEEGNDHHFFFHHTVNVTTTYLDQDTNTPPLPIGLSTKWKTGSAGTGTSQVILKHQPDQKDGTEAPGETDIDVTFQAIVF